MTVQAKYCIGLYVLVLLLGGCAFQGDMPAPVEKRTSPHGGMASGEVQVYTMPEAPLQAETLPPPSPIPVTAEPQAMQTTETPAFVEQPMPIDPLATNDEVQATPAVETLIASAKEAESTGQMDLALARLERATRIEPENSVLWYEMALLKRQRGELGPAREFARRAVELSASALPETRARYEGLLRELESPI